jgi:hypothetical protein
MRTKIRLTIESVAFGLMVTFFILFLVPFARLQKMVMLKNHAKPRVLWGAIPILSIRHGALAGRRYGYKSDMAVYQVYHLNKRDDFTYVFDKWMQFPFCLVSQYIIFLWAAFNYDIFHFYFDGGFLINRVGMWYEIQLLHLAGKKVIAIPYGCEARIESESKKRPFNFCMYCSPPFKSCNEVVNRRRVEHYCKYADIVLECSETVGYFPRNDGVWMYPIDTEGWQPFINNSHSVVRIVHATNHRVLKGTNYLIDAVASLMSEGYQIELTIVEKMANIEAREIYRRADIIADQFIAGCYAMFAVEGMALGKPVICYLDYNLLPYHREWEDSPIINAPVAKLKDVIRELVCNSELRQRIGEKGVPYVRKYHAIEAVGARLDRFYRFLWNNEGTREGLRELTR